MVNTTVTTSATDQTAPLRRLRNPDRATIDFHGASSRKENPSTPWASVATRDHSVPNPWAKSPEAIAPIRRAARARLVKRFRVASEPDPGPSL